jgi:hypothetical protein
VRADTERTKTEAHQQRSNKAVTRSNQLTAQNCNEATKQSRDPTSSQLRTKDGKMPCTSAANQWRRTRAQIEE